jgi:hypothetical protein
LAALALEALENHDHTQDEAGRQFIRSPVPRTSHARTLAAPMCSLANLAQVERRALNAANRSVYVEAPDEVEQP